MSVKQNLQAIYSRFPEPGAPEPSHFITLNGEQLMLVLVKSGENYPFAISSHNLSIDPAQFVAMIERAAKVAGVLDILDA